MNKEENKKRYLEEFEKNITRTGATNLLTYIKDKTDFFVAPASTRFHGSYEGGLCEHSLEVFDNLKKINDCFNLGYEMESVAIVSLTHDLCKANYYKVDFRNTKNEFGTWIKVPYYTVDDQFPLGHGEKSLAIVQGHIRLKPEEMMAIRWHMGGYDNAFKGGEYALNTAFDKYPLCAAIHSADLLANYVGKK